jgi:hypothetical protein
MCYPLSINKEVTIVCGKLSLEQIIKMFSKELRTKGNSIINVNGQNIKILGTEVFSSNTTLRRFNKGEINFIKCDGAIRVKGRILLIEHVIIFILIALFSAGLFQIGIDGIYISILLFSAAFVFLYLFPMMAFYSLFDVLIKKIEEEAKK